MMFMNELARMRIELEQLKEKERDLHEKLSCVRLDIEAHKSRIEHLAWAQTPINYLPSEILSYAFELAISPESSFDDSRMCPLALARVSRGWRHIILNTPQFWRYIDLNSRTNVSLVRAHVERSLEYPLDIAIKFLETTARLSTFIDVLLPHAHRWRTLEIYDGGQCLQFILRRINKLKFPSLAFTTIHTLSERKMRYPTFLLPENSPSLKSLDLNNVIPMEKFLPGQMVTDLSLQFSEHPLGPLTLPSLLSSQYLTELNLVYSACPPLQPDSIVLPFLTSLTLEGNHPRELISAIVAPRLSYFYLTAAGIPEGQLSTLFCGIESKFLSVQRLGFFVFKSGVDCCRSVASVFPNVRHVELHTEGLDDFFRMNKGGPCPADHWRALESLTFRGIKICCRSSTENLVQWLCQWNLASRPMLRVKFIECTFHSTNHQESDISNPKALSDFHDVIRRMCILEMVNVVFQAIAFMSLTSAPPPPLVCNPVLWY